MSTAELLINYETMDLELPALAEEFENASPENILRWATAEFGDDVAMATGFGAEGCVLVHMLAEITKDARIFYLDTDLLFPETYALCDQLALRYGVRFERRSSSLSLDGQAREFGDRLWERDADLCCKIRKVGPLEEMLSGLRAWITAIRRDQTPARATARVIEKDRKFGIIKINPLAAWSSRDIWDFIEKHAVPHNPLHKSGYASIGCTPCTTPVQIGEYPRAGRWRGSCKTECGLHR